MGKRFIMNTIYRFKIKTHPAYKNPDSVEYITMFYDEDKEEVIRYMQKYDKENGFTYIDRYGRCNSCADFVLSEETSLGKIIHQSTYRQIFDYNGKRI